MTRFVGLCAAAVLACASPSAHAALRGGFVWLEINNGGVSDTSGANLAHYRTFDLLFIADQAVGINGFNLGTAAVPDLDDHSLFTDAAIFNHAFGGDAPPNEALIDSFAALEFDTFLSIGDRNISFVPNSVDLTGEGDELFGVWFTQPAVLLNAGEHIRVARITLRRGFLLLTGNIEVGFNDSTTESYQLPSRTDFPAPGAAPALLMGCAVMTRRRR